VHSFVLKRHEILAVLIAFLLIRDPFIDDSWMAREPSETRRSFRDPAARGKCFSPFPASLHVCPFIANAYSPIYILTIYSRDSRESLRSRILIMASLSLSLSLSLRSGCKEEADPPAKDFRFLSSVNHPSASPSLSSRSSHSHLFHSPSPPPVRVRVLLAPLAATDLRRQ